MFLLAVGVAAADVGLGYHYKVPQTSYGYPSYQIGGNSGQYSSASASTVGADSNNAYQTAGFASSGIQSSSGLESGIYQTSSANANSVPAYLYGNSGFGSGFQSQFSSSGQYQPSAAEKFHQQYEIQHQPAQVYKHFYVHSAPEEPEPPKPRTPIVLPPPQKHYKIIFVKTPTESQRPQTVVPVQPPNEEKTIVYVLVKKPEEQPEVVVPKVEQKPPSKPEVFFIKYKNKEDSQAVINNIVKDYNQNGQQVSVLNPGLGDNSFTGLSGISDAGYDGPVISDAYNAASAVSDVSYNSGAGLSGVSYSSVSDGGYDNIQFNVPEGAVSSSAFGDNQGSGFSLASANSGADDSDVNISSTVASPVTISSTASTVDFDSASAIATSQGVPHETYGPPSFRTK